VFVRTLRSLFLFARIFWSYALQWALWSLTGRKLLGGRWERVHEINARRLARGFTALRGVYIKLGQIISVLGTFLPSAYANALERLQDDVPPRPFSEVVGRLEHAWGTSWRNRFSRFDETALAAASLAQVHRAQLVDGDDVAVKILYPDVQRLISVDLRVISWVMPIVHRLFGFRRTDKVVEQLRKMLAEETDYAHERDNIEKVRTVVGDRTDLVVPRVYEDLSNDSVLVLSFEHGVKPSDAQILSDAGSDPLAIANTLVDVYLTMLLEHHLFHADPHPGNFLVRGKQLVMLDYGAMGRVSEELVVGLKKVIMGGLSRNADQVLSGIEQMGFVAEDGDRELLRKVGREYLHALASMKVSNFATLDRQQIRRLSGFDQLRGRLRTVAKSVAYPEGYFYLERTMVLLFGVVAGLAPDKGLLGVAAPHASRALLRSYSRRRETAQATPS
jgi:predicted unusual protein kinase regulating ubiquinone biosynthesis (AarF/ABC1/UbiB family)